MKELEAGKYVDIVCGFDDSQSESFGVILTKIDDNGYACVDWGYGVKLEHIIHIKPLLEEIDVLE